ncbi:hypothetical protein [Fictibacillus barbaricus]|uniref:Uncharacterized protein n=1 Tax=Fictibacillus barbaricus TaxID=182136 RepID=A0ABS2ZKG3_9BACL|nr:hypothetical protein [Fictibacillus barbaricus]MBN3547813.1 hypothetical protein [Fictibacillus barbaricus]GGB51761.1 hypothetical protein GCM10007199_16960 [Fictibacillus barbaricus]
MTLTKLKNKSLVTDLDLSYSLRLGLPIEVYCTERHETLAFGRIDHFCEMTVVIQGKKHDRDSCLFFGCPCQ